MEGASSVEGEDEDEEEDDEEADEDDVDEDDDDEVDADGLDEADVLALGDVDSESELENDSEDEVSEVSPSGSVQRLMLFLDCRATASKKVQEGIDNKRFRCCSVFGDQGRLQLDRS